MKSFAGRIFSCFFAVMFLLLTPIYAASDSEVSPILKFLKMGSSKYTTVNPANAIGRDVNSLYSLFAWVGVGIFSLVLLVFIVVVFRFRETKNPNPKDIHGNFFLELCWTTLPIIILIIIGVPTIRLLYKISETPTVDSSGFVFPSSPDKQYQRILEVTAVGHQWWWEFEYTGWQVFNEDTGQVSYVPINRVTANEAYFPVNVPVRLNVVSEDVIHSFWMPRIAGKRDVIPGRPGEVFLFFEEQNSFAGQCALYCGASHSLMKFNSHVVSMENFEDWLNWGKGQLIVQGAAAQRGLENVYSCLACHTLNGVFDFVPRAQRIQAAMDTYDVEKIIYQKDLEEWEANIGKDIKWEREKINHPTRPKPPTKPELFKGDFVTVAPDLTDLRYRPTIAAGVKTNTKQNLLEWIKRPNSIKPEDENSVSVRMMAYEHLYPENTIRDVIELLTSLSYSGSKELDFSPANLVAQGEASLAGVIEKMNNDLMDQAVSDPAMQGMNHMMGN